VPPRRDLRLEALAAILDGEILVHSHCYRADEILMLIRASSWYRARATRRTPGRSAPRAARPAHRAPRRARRARPSRWPTCTSTHQRGASS
jgi:hypothetical protein